MARAVYRQVQCTAADEVTGKPSIAGPKLIIAFYAAPMTFDIIMTGMTVYKVLYHTRQGRSSSLLKRMLRGGLFYFFAITSLNLPLTKWLPIDNHAPSVYTSIPADTGIQRVADSLDF
ncbi:hypothetical protein C8R46DRAFT_1194168 [Mycena filopes]|nr:hypothetical protein C8R46DRAFT_1194168 [Mycena filopes]